MLLFLSATSCALSACMLPTTYVAFVRLRICRELVTLPLHLLSEVKLQNKSTDYSMSFYRTPVGNPGAQPLSVTGIIMGESVSLTANLPPFESFVRLAPPFSTLPV